MRPDNNCAAALANEVKQLLQTAGREAALRHAMTGCEPLLKSPTRALRFALRRQVFRNIRGIGYQAKDFEATDYQLYELEPDLPMFRGPAVSQRALAGGDYFCVIGAAQTYGRLIAKSWPQLLSEALDLPVLNLSRGGGGPEFFLDRRLMDLAGRARFVVLQVMSGRSVGCEEFPGGRRIVRDSKPTDLHRWDVLEALWQKDPAIALTYVRRWNDSYLGLYHRLKSAIACQTLLFWISERNPDDWEPEQLLRELDWGPFPQLVGRELYERVAALFDLRFEYVFEPTSEQPRSRITGEPCPFFWTDNNLHDKFGYYPTSQTNAAVAEAMLPRLQEIASRKRRHSGYPG